MVCESRSPMHCTLTPGSLGTDPIKERRERESGQSMSCHAFSSVHTHEIVFRELRAWHNPFETLFSLPSHTYAQHIHEAWTILSLFLLAIQVSETRSSQPRASRCSRVVGFSRIVSSSQRWIWICFSLRFRLSQKKRR